MWKNLKSKGKEWLDNAKAQNREHLGQQDFKQEQTPYSPSQPTIDQKPFTVNLNQLWQYDSEELSDLIHKYEDYVVFLRKKCHEIMNRCMAAEEQLERQRQERSPAMHRSDSGKQQSMEQRNDLFDMFAPNKIPSSPLKEPWSPEPRQLEDVIAKKVNLYSIDDGLLRELRDTSSKMINQLGEIRNNFFMNSFEMSGSEYPFQNAPGNAQTNLLTDTDVDLLGGSGYPNNSGQAFNDWGQPARTQDKMITIKLQESTRNQLVSMIGDIEMTMQLVLPKFLDINNKIKNQEKVIIRDITQLLGGILQQKKDASFNNSGTTMGTMGGSDAEVNELKSQLWRAESQSNELRSQLSTTRSQLEQVQARLVETERRANGQQQQQQQQHQVQLNNAREESYKQEIKNLNMRIAESDRRVKELGEAQKKTEMMLKESENKFRLTDSRTKQLDTKLKETEARLKDVDNKLRETERLKRDLESKVKLAENQEKRFYAEAEERTKELERYKKELEYRMNTIQVQEKKTRELERKIEEAELTRKGLEETLMAVTEQKPQEAMALGDGKEEDVRVLHETLEEAERLRENVRELEGKLEEAKVVQGELEERLREKEAVPATTTHHEHFDLMSMDDHPVEVKQAPEGNSKDVESLREQLREIEQNRREEVERLNENIRELEGRLEEERAVKMQLEEKLREKETVPVATTHHEHFDLMSMDDHPVEVKPESESNNKEIETLRESIRELKEKIEELQAAKSELEEKAKEGAGHKERVESVEKEAQETQSMLEARISELEGARSELEEKAKEGAQYKERFEAIESESRETQSQLEARISELEGVRSELEGLRHRVNELESGKMGLESRLSEAEHVREDLAEVQKTLRYREEEIENRVKEIEGLKQMLMETETRLEEAEKKLEETQVAKEELEDKVKEADFITKQQGITEEAAKEAQMELENTLKESRELREKVRELEKKLHDAQGAKAGAEEKMNEFVKKLHDSLTAKGELEEKVKDMDKLHRRIEALELIEKKGVETEKQLGEKIEELRAKEEELEDLRDRLKDVEKLKRELEDRVGGYQGLEEILRQAQVKAVELEEEVRVKTQEVAVQKQKVEEVEEKERASQELAVMLDIEREKQGKRISELEEQVKEYEAGKMELETKISELNVKVESMEEMEERVRESQRVKEESIKEIEKARRGVEEVREELRRKDELLESQKESIEDMEGKLEEMRGYETELNSKREELELLRVELKNAQDSINEAEEAIRRLQDELQSEKEKFWEVESKVYGLERDKMEVEDRLRAAEGRNEEAENTASQLIHQMDDAEKRVQQAKQEIEELKRQVEKEKQGNQQQREDMASYSEIQRELQQQIDNLRGQVDQLKEEKKGLATRVSEVEQAKVDMENKWIQERLKHHQTGEDMQKLKEKLGELERNLDQESHLHRNALEKNEAYKKKIAEQDKKGVHYKKTIKNLAQQIMDLHNSVNKTPKREKIINLEPEKKEESSGPQPDSAAYRKDTAEDEREDDTVREAIETAETITNQIAKIHELNDKLEETLNEMNALRQTNEDLINSNKDLARQVKVLQEKRETGLQEIQRLNTLVEKMKSHYNPDQSLKSAHEASDTDSVHSHQMRGSTQNSVHKQMSTPPPHHKHSDSMISNSSTKKPSIKGSKQLSGMKKNLEMLYKEIILTLTSDKVTDPELAESLVKIEKKVNDTVLLLQEYIEAISRA